VTESENMAVCKDALLCTVTVFLLLPKFCFMLATLLASGVPMKIMLQQ
jgi:hypothetical protein